MEVVFEQQPPPETPAAPAIPGAAPDAAAVAAEVEMANETMWGNPKRGTQPAPDPAPEPAAAAPAPAPAPAAPAAEPAAEPDPAHEETTDDVIRRTARETALAMQPATPVATATDGFEMTPEDQEVYEVLLRLEAHRPAKWEGKPAKFLAYTKAYAAYGDKWSTDNPEKEFNPDDEEHKVWFDKNDPGVTEAEIELGKEILALADEARAVTEPIRTKAALDEAMPGILTRVDRDALAMFTEVSPEFAAIMTRDGKPELTPQNFEKLIESDPIGGTIVRDAWSKHLDPMLQAIEKSADPRINFKLNPKTDPMHRQIHETYIEAEANMAKAPASTHVRDGKQWKSLEEMNALVKKAGRDEAKIAELNDRYWVLTADDLKKLVIDKVGKGTKKIIEEIDKLAKKKYGSNGHATPASAAAPAPAPAAQPQPAARTAAPPSMSSGSDRMPTPTSAPAAHKNEAQVATDVMFK